MTEAIDSKTIEVEESPTSEELSQLKGGILEQVSALYAKKIVKEYKKEHPDSQEGVLGEMMKEADMDGGPLLQILSMAKEVGSFQDEIKNQIQSIGDVFSGEEDEVIGKSEQPSEDEEALKEMILSYLTAQFSVFGINILGGVKDGMINKLTFIKESTRKELKSLRKELRKKEKKDEDVDAFLDQEKDKVQAAIVAMDSPEQIASNNNGTSDDLETKGEYYQKEYIPPFPQPFVITSPFGERIHPLRGDKDMHTGIDIGQPQGTPILSMSGGYISKNQKTGPGGREIRVKDDAGKEFCYLHLEEESPLPVNTRVVVGQEIGKVGSTGSSTGPHLHLTIKEDGKNIDPMERFPDLFPSRFIQSTA